MFAVEAGCGTKAPALTRRTAPGTPLVVTAIREEFEAIAACLSDGERLRTGRGDQGISLRGRISGASVLLAMTGDGEARAGSGLSLLLRESPVSVLIGAGVAGALVPSLRVGDLVVATRLVNEQGEAAAPDGGWLSRAIAVGARPATIVTVAGPLTSSKEKQELAARVGASDSAPAVVDMESAAWGRAAASQGVPFVILRAVSDAFEEDLPGLLSSCLSPDGSVDRAAVARRLLLRPGALPALLSMRRRVRSASEGLGRFLTRLLATGR